MLTMLKCLLFFSFCFVALLQRLLRRLSLSWCGVFLIARVVCLYQTVQVWSVEVFVIRNSNDKNI